MRYQIAMRLAFVFAPIVFSPDTSAADLIIDGVPIPGDAKVGVVPVSAPENHVRFSGVWIGAWGGDLKHILTVENIKSDGTANVIYAWGDNSKAAIVHGWRRHSARVTGETLTIAADFKAEYKLSSASTATASWQRGENRSLASMIKTEFPAITAPNARIAWGTWESLMLDTNLRESRKAIRLEVVVYKPARNGPWPLAVINHGSTGSGDKPELFKGTFNLPALAQFLVAKGWIVAFPQRRGRGRSEGLYDEGFLPDRSRYACEPSQSLPGADRALLDIEAAIEALHSRADVQPGPVLIGGVSRGGVLSVVYAGKHQQQIKGVMNFVGGWMGTGCSSATEINTRLFREGGKYPTPTLWLYGDNDPFYPLPHSRANFAEFQTAGGSGKFVEFAGR